MFGRGVRSVVLISSPQKRTSNQHWFLDRGPVWLLENLEEVCALLDSSHRLWESGGQWQSREERLKLCRFGAWSLLGCLAGLYCAPADFVALISGMSPFVVCHIALEAQGVFRGTCEN